MGRIDAGAQPQWGEPTEAPQQQGQYYYGGQQGFDPRYQQQQYYGPPGGQQEYSAPSPPGSSHGYPGSKPSFFQEGGFPPQGPPPFPQQYPHSPSAPVYSPQPLQQQAFQVQAPVYIQTQPWSTDLFGCFEDPTSCVITTLAPCVTYGQITEILDQGTTTCLNGGAMYTLILCCLLVPCFLSYTARSKVRRKFGLPEDPMSDLCTHIWCECCALSQEYRELKNRGMDPALGWFGVQQAMTPPGQPAMVR